MKPKHLNNLFSIPALAVLLFFADLVLGQPTYQLPVGTRPRSMGEAFLAVADDGNAIFWNPAGLAQLERIQLSFAYANIFGLDIHDYYASFASRVYFIPPLTDYLSFGIGWSGFQTKDEELDVSQDQFNFSLAFRPPASDWFVFKYLSPFLKPLSLGVTAKYLQQRGRLDGQLEGDAKGWGGGWKNLIRDFGVLYNLGALAHVLNGLHVGFVVHDLDGTEIQHDNPGHTAEKILPQNVRWGLSYRPLVEWQGPITISDPVLAIDVDDRVHVGLEFWLSRMLAIRAGFQKDRHTDESPTLSFGLGFKTPANAATGVNGDYSFMDSPGLPNTPGQFGVTAIFKNNPRLIRIEDKYINEVFTSIYPYYGKGETNFGRIKLKNVYHEPITARISFEVKEYALATEDIVTIKPDSTVDYQLRALFTSKIMALGENKLTGKIKATYNYKNSEFSTKAEESFTVFGKNYLTWDDPAKACAFITSDDPAVQKFCNSALRAQQPGQGLINKQVARALTLFESLAAYGVRYQEDPNLPYSKVQNTKYYIDKVKYPSELLRAGQQQGDCDDLSVLYAALLEHMGVSTALLSIPRHLFMMFNTGVPINQRYRFLVPDTMLVLKSGTIWLPIETTLLDSSFARAWLKGAKTYRQAERDSSLQVFFVREGWAKYGTTSPDLPPPDNFKLKDFNKEIEQSIATIQRWHRDYLEENYFAILQKQPQNLPVRNRLGILFAQNGRLSEAKQQFHAIYRANDKYLPALNNLANVYFMLAEYDSAEYFYQKAMTVDWLAPGVYLNLAIAKHWRKDHPEITSAARRQFEAESFAALQEAGRLLNYDTNVALEYLQLPEYPEEEEKKELSGTSWRDLWQSLKGKFYKVFKPPQPTQKPIVESAAPKAGERDEDRAAILWWST